MTLLADVLKAVKPSAAERRKELEIAKKAIWKLRRAVPKRVDIELAGSIVKNTNLREDRDIDIFLLFPSDYSKKDLLTIGLEYAKKAIHPAKWEIGYAEHPYLKTRMGGCDIDIVPSFKILCIEEKCSSVDRSPLHTRFIKERLDEKRCDEVRLLKKFLKRLGIYGAELAKEGFSGYLCELLILKCGSFEALLKAAATWMEPVIQIEGKKTDERALKLCFKSPLIVIDPVDSERNVAAVVSETSLSKFIIAARAFLKSPTKEFFFEKAQERKLDLKKELSERGTRLFLISFPAARVVPDILFPQLKKSTLAIKNQAELFGFKIFGSDFWSDGKRCAILLEFESALLSKIKKAIGPEVIHEKGVGDFLKAHGDAVSGPWIEGKRIVAVERRKVHDAKEFIKNILSAPQRYGIASHVAEKIRDAKIFEGTEIAKGAPPNFIHDYLKRREFFL